MSPADSIFLTFESRDAPLHIGGLQVFSPAADGVDVAELYRRLVADDEVADTFAKRARRSVASGGQWAWEPDPYFDIEHHVRVHALARPGRVADLFALCSRLHGGLLDRSRPLWELHLIEGVQDGRFAIYFKAHHALMDGAAAQRLLSRALSPDPDERGLRPLWAPRYGAVGEGPDAAGAAESGVEQVARLLRTALSWASDVNGLPAAVVESLKRGAAGRAAPVSLAAPRSVLNVPITGSRRFAARSWPLAEFREISAAAGVTVNDVVLAACSGALRRYLLEAGSLPDKPLVAMAPIALSVEGRDHDNGNAVAAVMCNLNTDLADPAARLAAIHQSMAEGKDELRGRTPHQAIALTGLGMSPLALQLLPGVRSIARPPFNLVISNLAGPARPLYLNGARLEASYPLSVPYHGQALNITCISYADELSFGFTGCRQQVPHLHRVPDYLDDELSSLASATSTTGANSL